MKNKIIALMFSFLVLFSFSAFAANYDMYLKVDSVKGEAKEINHKDWISVTSYQHLMSRLDPKDQSRRGKVTHYAFKVVKEIDSSTPILSSYVPGGNKITEVTLEILGSGSKTVLMKYVLKGVVVSSVAHKLSEKGVLEEEVSFSYDSIQWEYNLLSGTGGIKSTIKAGWDVVANKKI